MRASTVDLQTLLVSLLGSSESMGAQGSTTLAESFVTGALGSGQPEVGITLAGALGRVLQSTPGGGSWVVRLMRALDARGDAISAHALDLMLQQVLRESREACINLFRGVQMTPDPARLEDQWRQLEVAGAPLAGLLPACALLVEEREQVPSGAQGELVREALLGLATLDLVGATPTGQRVVRHALLMQEQGESIFLDVVPLAPRLLIQPNLFQHLAPSGLSAIHFQYGGGTFVQKVGVQVSRALIGPLLARSQKGDADEARRLLVSSIQGNAALFGMSPEGSRFASSVLEGLRARPNPAHVPRTMTRLEKVARVHPGRERVGSVESLRVLVTALAERDPQAAPRSTGSRLSLGAAPTLTTLEMEATHTSLVKARETQREEAARVAAAAAKAKVPAGKRPLPWSRTPPPPGSGSPPRAFAL